VIDERTTSTYITTDIFLKPNPASSTNDKNTNLNLSKIWQHNFNIGKFYEVAVNEGERDNNEVTDNIRYSLYIAESGRHECSKLQIKIAGEEIQALIDTGCEMSI